MRLLWHIIQKDARRVRWTLALWIAVMAGRYLLGAHLLRAGSLTSAGWLQWTTYDDWLWIGQIVLAYLLAGWIVQEDLLVDPRAFWLTRPISRLRLLGAKLLGVGLLVCVLPAVVALPWWLSCGCGARDVAAAAAETVFWFACLASVAVALASLTDDLARFVLYSFILALAAGTYAAVLIAIKLKWSESWLDLLSAGLVQTRVWVSAVWVLVMCAVAAAHQYLTRRTWSSWALLVAGLIALVGPVQFWPWDLSGLVEARSPAVPVVEGVSVDFLAARLVPLERTPDPHALLDLELRVDGIGEDYALSRLRAENTWRWPDGVQDSQIGADSQRWNTLVHRQGWNLLGLRDEQQWAHAGDRAFREFIRGRQRMKFPGAARMNLPTGTWSIPVHLPPSLGAKMLRQPPSWEAQIEGELVRARLAAWLPLRVGATGGHGAEALRIVAMIDESGTRVMVVVAQSWSTAGRLRIADAAVVSYQDANAPGYLVFSQDKSRVIYPLASGIVAHRIGTVAVVRRQLTLMAPRRWQGHEGSRGAWETDSKWPGWLGHATLARVVEERVGRFEQTLHLDRMVVEVPGAQPGGGR